MAAPRDLGPLAVENPDYTAFQDGEGKPLPFRHGLRRLDDGTMLPQIPMGICAARDGTVYVTVISPFTLLAIRPGATRN